MLENTMKGWATKTNQKLFLTPLLTSTVDKMTDSYVAQHCFLLLCMFNVCTYICV